MRGIGIVERKILGALLLMCNDNMEVSCTLRSIADVMEYKTVGGAMTYALEMLEMKNYIVKLEKGRYKILL